MIRFLLIAALSLTLCFTTGCGNFSPRQKQEIQNDGKIGEIENMANSMKSEIGKLQTQAEIHDSKLEKLQQGLANFQQNFENSGVQILSGPGGLLLAVVALFGMFITILHYRSLSQTHEKTANLLAEKIANLNDPDLEESVFVSAMNTDVEGQVLHLIRKHKK